MFRIGLRYEWKITHESYKDFPEEPSEGVFRETFIKMDDELEDKIKAALAPLFPGFDLTLEETHIYQYSEVNDGA